MDELKPCTKCGEVKPLSDFGVLRTVKSGRRSRCKRCEADAAMERHWAKRDEILAKAKERYNADPDKHRARALRYHSDNRDASLAKAKAWKRNNRDRVTEYNAQHYAENRAYHRARHTKWIDANRDRHREYMRGWYEANPGKHSEYANRRLENPRVKLENAIRCRIWYGIVKGSKRGRRTMTLLGYSTDELKRHLERQFAKGMGWDNYGEWHIDHIVPLSSFLYSTPDDPDFRRAWALTNLRPMWGKDNLEKGAKRLTLL